jgi:hypothetical protein
METDPPNQALLNHEAEILRLIRESSPPHLGRGASCDCVGTTVVVWCRSAPEPGMPWAATW